METHQQLRQVMHMEHLEVVEQLEQGQVEAKVAVLMEDRELALLGYQHNSVQQVQTVVQDTLAVEVEVVLLLIMVLAAVVAPVVEMVVKVQDTLLELELLTQDLVAEETLKVRLPVMEERVLSLP